MAFCKQCGKELSETASFCRNCGAKVEYKQEQHQNQPYVPYDAPSTRWDFLCYTFPIVGLILCARRKDRQPIWAAHCEKWAKIGFVILTLWRVDVIYRIFVLKSPILDVFLNSLETGSLSYFFMMLVFALLDNYI